jgi:hypothetical protein
MRADSSSISRTGSSPLDIGGVLQFFAPECSMLFPGLQGNVDRKVETLIGSPNLRMKPNTPDYAQSFG